MLSHSRRIRQRAYPFVRDNTGLFDEASRLRFATSLVEGYFRKIEGIFSQRLSQRFRQSETLDDVTADTLFNGLVDEHFRLLKSLPSIKVDDDNTISDADVQTIVAALRDSVNDTRKRVFGRYPVSGPTSAKLNKIGLMLLHKQLDSDGYTGVVVAGYGDRDVFPALEAYHVEGIIQNHLKHRRYSKAAISPTNGASIRPFAQSEMIRTFIEGVDPSYESFIESQFFETLQAYSRQILLDLASKAGIDITGLAPRFSKINTNVVKALVDTLRKRRSEDSIDQVVKIVASLPKPELAAMAESLVNLTTLKKKVSEKIETVGGPIDVALISRGDGFVWIKRKHYFDPKLNQHFLRNYYRRDRISGQETEGPVTDRGDDHSTG